MYGTESGSAHVAEPQIVFTLSVAIVILLCLCNALINHIRCKFIFYTSETWDQGCFFPPFFLFYHE